jgi:two-component system, cell cycle sensor histidine kinase and response regulator CckA
MDSAPHSNGSPEPREILEPKPARIKPALDEELARLAMQVGRMFAFEWNPRTDEVRRSSNAADIIGPTDGATRQLGRDSLERVHPEDRERLVSLVRSLTPERDTYEIEYRVIQPTGQMVTLRQSARAFFDHDGVMTRLVGVSAEITLQKQLEAAFYESELRYKEVFDNFLECVFVLDVSPDGRFKISRFNPAEEKSTGLSNAEVAGKFVEDVLAEDVAQGVIAHYRRCLEEGTVIHYDEELDLPIGHRYFHTNLIPIRNETGRIHRIVGCCIDFTDLKRSQEEALARQKLESVGVLAGGIAHDFNNLLGAILASTELALAERADSSVVEQELMRIRTATIRGAEIVRQMMIYGGKDSPDAELLDISLLVDEMLRLLKVSISKHAVLKTELRSDLPAVLANAGQIRQVVMNLISNASEAIGEREGTIVVTTQVVRVGRETPLAADANLPEGDYVMLGVSDTGCGMTPEVRSRIFDPFFTTKVSGRGLGLAVTQGIIRNHGGRIHVVSSPDQGTTFQVLLPFVVRDRSRESPNATAQAAADHSPPPTQTILVVEDEDMLRGAVSKALRRQGFSVVEAHDGSTAIAMIGASKGKFDALLLDVTLPGMSSREVLESARRAHPDVKVILTSAYSKETVDPDFAGLGVEHFIRKPFGLRDLFSLLQNALSA